MSIEKIIKQEEIKSEIFSILSSVAREGIENLVLDLDNIGYFTAPASTQHHLNYDGGLAEHSLNVYKLMSKMHKVMFPENFSITEDNIIITSLLHDIGKSNFYGFPEYKENILKSGKVSDKKPYVVDNVNRPPVPHSVASIQIVSKYINLTKEELTAILYHDSLYTPMGRELLGKEQPLQQLLHYADFWCAHFIESSGVSDEY